MKRLSQKKIETIIDELYWKAHTDGLLCGKSGKINFGVASIAIEAAITKFLQPKEFKKRIANNNTVYPRV